LQKLFNTEVWTGKAGRANLNFWKVFNFPKVSI
jgi:hypothetical protein